MMAAHQAQLSDHTVQIKVGGCRANPLRLQVCYDVSPARVKRCHDMPLRGDWVSASKLHELPVIAIKPYVLPSDSAVAIYMLKPQHHGPKHCAACSSVMPPSVC